MATCPARRLPLAAGGQPQSLAVIRGKVVVGTAGATGSEPAVDGLLSYSYLRYAEDGLYLVGATDNELYRSADGTEWTPVQR